jgi:hypothetical protein
MAGAQKPIDIQSDPNPLSTNIPSLGWRGEAIRLVKCTDDLSDTERSQIRHAIGRDSIPINFGTSWFVEEWGGTNSVNAGPKKIDSSENLFLANGEICVRASFFSQTAGLARIKLAANLDTLSFDRADDATELRSRLGDINIRTHLFSHQFLAGWMTLQAPSLTDLGLGGNGPNDAGNPLGSGNVDTFWAGSAKANEGVLKATVKGTLPVGGDFEGSYALGNITLPDAWPTLAARFAAEENPNNENPSFRWDIHDESALGSYTTEGHPHAPAGACDPSDRPDTPLPAGRDAVDNCAGGEAFSRVFDADGPGALAPFWIGLSKEPTVGPFDPQRPQETLLGDGQLTADDAPMPAARIDFTIGANKGDGKDIDGVGSFKKTDKHKLFSFSRVKPPSSANSNGQAQDIDDVVGAQHNLYAPYYQAYVPATGSPDAAASGTDGAAGNDFSGYLVGDGRTRGGGDEDTADRDHQYDYWDIAHEFGLRKLNGTETKCLRRDDERPSYRYTPEGPQKVAVYTDEHGQAMVDFNPGTGFWFDSLLATQPDLGGNLNGGCDLKYLKDGVLGNSNITAGAFYPYQPVSDQPAATASMRKTVKSLFAKYLAVFPKGTTPDLANARIVVAHAQDIDGKPFAGEIVCFSDTSASGTIQPFSPAGNWNGYVGPYYVKGQQASDDPINNSHKRVCVKTNQNGNAAIEVFESQGAEIDIIGDFTAEGLLRDVKVPFGAPPVVIDPGLPPVGSGTPPLQPEQNGLKTPTAAVVAAATNGQAKVSSARTRRAARATVRFARVVNSARGQRYLSLNLRGRAGVARVRIQLIGYDGKVVRSVNKSVRVGRTVRISGVRISANVRNVRVTVAR